MTPDDLRGLIETQSVECKQSLSEKREGMEALNAMVNAESAAGLVLFGVAPDHTIVGIEPGDVEKSQRSLGQHIRDKFCPMIRFEIEAVNCDSKWVLVVRAMREPHVPLCEYDGRAYIREGSAKRQLPLPEKLQLIRRRDRDQHPGPWRCSRCGSVAGQVSSMVFDGETMRRTYDCDCGGEYWPAN